MADTKNPTDRRTRRSKTSLRTATLPIPRRSGRRRRLRRRWKKQPEKPIGAPTGVNLDEHGHARFSTISN